MNVCVKMAIMMIIIKMSFAKNAITNGKRIILFNYLEVIHVKQHQVIAYPVMI